MANLGEFMNSIIQFLLAMCFLTMSCSFALAKSPAQVSQGNVIYSFKSGKIQCQSQIDPNGQLTILLTSLADNTKFQFQNLTSKNSKKRKNEYVLKALMFVTNSKL